MKYQLILTTLAVSAYAAAVPQGPGGPGAESLARTGGQGGFQQGGQGNQGGRSQGGPSAEERTRNGASDRGAPGGAAAAAGGPEISKTAGAGSGAIATVEKVGAGSGRKDRDQVGQTYQDSNTYESSNSYSEDYKKNKEQYGPTYAKKQESYEKKTYAAYSKETDYQSYQTKREKEDYKPHRQQPPKYDQDKDHYDNFKGPKYFHQDDECDLEWYPKEKKGNDYDWDSYKTKIYLVDCDDYDHPKPVCDDCGHGKYKWKVPADCEPSDGKKPKWYRLKYVKHDDEESCSYSEEFPIYKKGYENEPENDECPKKECEECGAPPAKPTEKEVEEDKEKPEAPEAPEAEKEAESPEKEAESPEKAESPEAAKSPEAGESAEAPAVYTGAGSAVRASLSVIVGVAALVTFAL